MPELLKRCPKCGSPNLFRVFSISESGADEWHLCCEDCGHEGPIGESVPQAIKLWNEGATA